MVKSDSGFTTNHLYRLERRSQNVEMLVSTAPATGLLPTNRKLSQLLAKSGSDSVLFNPSVRVGFPSDSYYFLEP